MDRDTYDKFRQIVYERSGISLGPSKEALVASRIGKRLRALGMDDYVSYLDFIAEDDTGRELGHLLDAISTHVTSFFREPEHFDFVGKAVARWFEGGQRTMRFWTAACSTGEEPYSLAITLIESIGRRRADIQILATDLSQEVIDQARRGIYGEEKIREVNPDYLDRYFDRREEGEQAIYEVRRVVKNIISFARLNLAHTPFPMRGPFDIIICRNVMIYFDNRVRRQLLAEIQRLLKPGGFLIVGHAESLTGMISDFVPFKPSIYVKD
jgi:chemotaxis protein methyltransferase CheR